MQGINDLVTPFLAVFLGQHFDRGVPLPSWDPTALPEEVMLEVLPPSPPLHPSTPFQQPLGLAASDESS